MTEQAVSNTELEEFKIKVATVARDLAAQHGLCTVVDDALEQMGLNPTKKAVEVTLGVSGKLVLQMDEMLYNSMDDEARNAWIKERVNVDMYGGSLRVAVTAAGGAGAAGGGTISFTKNDIQVVSVSDEITVPAPIITAGGQWWRLRPNGRALHFVTDHYIQQADNGRWAEATCGRAGSYNNSWDRTPPANTYPRCTRCVERRGNR